MRRIQTVILFVLTFAAGTSVSLAQKFRTDDPLLVDNDSVAPVKEVRRSQPSDTFDFLLHTFSHPGDRRPLTAVNINTLGEVPDSSWFQNRHGQRQMTIEELVRGPSQSGGPSTDGVWTVVGAKSEGITPGFRIKDRRGDVYVMKFDPKNNPEMATAAEVISTKFFYAMGFNVPENYITTFRREQLKVGTGAMLRDALGKERAMTESDLDQILARVNRQADKTYRAVASRFLQGQPLGPFRYYGTRSDDPNDIFRHEHRRELRGLWVMSAWLDHDDSRAINSQDMLVAGQGKQFVRHYLIDFGSTLGSGSTQPQKPRAGWEYMWDPAAAGLRIATLGIVDKPWVRAKYVADPALGRLEFDKFHPDSWKPEYPNPAFENARPEDSYWAAKIVMAFSDEEIRAIVKTGEISDAAAENLLVNWLILRRDRIGKSLLTALPTMDRFELVDGNTLIFDHLGGRYGFQPRPNSYLVRWYRLDNPTNSVTPMSAESSSFKPQIPLPSVALAETNAYFVARIFESGAADGVAVTVWKHDNELKIVGIERDVTRER